MIWPRGCACELDPLLTNVAPADDAITFAEQMMQLLEEASFSTTYKHALLWRSWTPARSWPTTRPGTSHLGGHGLAERVIARYWPHAVPYPPTRSAEPLSQSGTGQAEIVVRKARARRHGTARRWPRPALRRPGTGSSTTVAWKLARMPLPRLQRVGTTERRFLYDILD